MPADDKSASEGAWRKLGLAVGATALLALSGCGEPVTFYEPGQYKGQPDPLLEKSGSAELVEELSARFEQGQARQ